MIDALTGRVLRVQTVVRRATLLPLLVRAGLFGCAFAALLFASPAVLLTSQVLLVLLLVAGLPAVWPRSMAPTLVALLAVGGWLFTTAGFGERISLWRVITLAALLYLVHVLATLAASLPYDAIVAVAVLAGRLARAFGVVLASAVLIVVVLAVAGVASFGAFTLAAVAGLVLAVAAAALLVRSSWSGP